MGGGPRVKILDFIVSHMCYNPNYLVSKMGSFVSQLATVAEIWCDKNGRWFSTGTRFLKTLDGQTLVKMAEHFHLRDALGYNCIRILSFLIFRSLLALLSLNLGVRGAKLAQIRGKNGQKWPKWPGTTPVALKRKEKNDSLIMHVTH